MKKNIYAAILAATVFAAINLNAQTSANKSLSNLNATTKINSDLLPDDAAHNLGSASSSWTSLYLKGGLFIDTKKFINTAGLFNTCIGNLSGKSITSGGYNTGLGYQTLYSTTNGYYNTTTGYASLYHNTSGSSNTATGMESLFFNQTGNYNTAAGYFTLYDNLNGSYNTANGFEALYNNTNSYNTATGAYALVRNSSGYNNTANGVSALYYNTTGIDNTATGLDALTANTTGSYNTSVGNNALTNTTASDGNTAVGSNAGSIYDNGFYNVFVGANTDVNGADYYNDIAIGQGTVCTDVSQVTMGNSATTSYRAYANWSNISDGRFKKNIQQNVPGLEFINKLQPVTYTLDATGIDNFLHKEQPQDKQVNEKAKALMSKALTEKEKTVFTGFIAQDVEKAAKSLNYDFSGVDAAKNSKDVYGLRYAEFVVPLVKAVQELSKQNDDKNAKINDLETRLAKLEAMINAGKSTVSGQQTTTMSSASLQQNAPNPFSNSTTINYFLPQTYSSAKIIITDKNGAALKEISLSTKGKGSVNIDASTLSAGSYQYTLYVDGKVVSTKQMIAAK